jgi:hypothetical protein
MAASLKVKRTPITTPPYKVPSVDITPDPPIFSLVTTFKQIKNILHMTFVAVYFTFGSLAISKRIFYLSVSSLSKVREGGGIAV